MVQICEVKCYTESIFLHSFVFNSILNMTLQKMQTSHHVNKYNRMQRYNNVVSMKDTFAIHEGILQIQSKE